MIHRYRRLWLLVGLLAAFVAAPVGARAAVETDATVTVTFVDGVTLLPVEGAAVLVKARQGDTVLAELTATTDASGVAVVEAVPREAGEGDAVVVDVSASRETTFTDEDTGCVFAESVHAERLGVAVDAADVAVAFTPAEQNPASSITCPPDESEPSQEVEEAVGTPGHTLPPTDALQASPSTSNDGFAVIVGLVALASAVVFVAPRRRLSRVRARR
ncbi:MAG TPA: hypothetical protein VFV72_07300 [Candidatus Limnocylindrales bacterium]|nr:hypothetical protein [Candidatus Limnocylindrales bacterium]